MTGLLDRAEAYPRQLLDYYLEVARRRGRHALPVTVVRAQSLSARRLLSHAATDGSASLQAVLAAARGDERARKELQPNRLDPVRLADLARAIAQQHLLPRDLHDALDLSEMALEVFGPDSIPSALQGLHVQLAYQLSDSAHVLALLDAYPAVPDLIRSTLQLDLTNPFINPDGLDADQWLRLFEGLFPECRLMFSDEADHVPFDRLMVTEHRRIATGPYVSVIVTCFEPDAGLLTAVRSILNQSWTNVEVLVVDDGSPPRYDRLLKRCCQIDGRVKLIKLPTNVGTYRARNVAFDAASGEFITFLDSDDWAHPRRLERQIAPLVGESSVLATMAASLRATDEIRLTEPALSTRVTYVPSLMFRKDPVMARLGYLDCTRKAADNEYVGRIRAVFGTDAVRQLTGVTLGLYRRGSGSLSHADFRGPWMHPARLAYKSAYDLWHRQIEAGEAEPYLTKDPEQRPFPAPQYLGPDPGDSSSSDECDVVFVGDWRRYGWLQRALVDEVKALSRRGVRVGVMHMEALQFMTAEAERLCHPIQAMINRGVASQCLPTDEREVPLLIVCDPLCLQFAAGRATRLKVGQAIIVGSQAPGNADGEYLTYVPRACTAAVERLFSTRPRWLPQDPQVREALVAKDVKEPELLEWDMGPVIDPEVWCLGRSGFRSALPIVGFHSEGERSEWPKDGETLLQVYPDSPGIDVRILGGQEVMRTMLGSTALPANWMTYAGDELSVRNFLFQIDFWAYFPHPARIEGYGRSILEALASGCVVILPHRFWTTFGDAAVYACPSEVRAIISRYHRNSKRFVKQSKLAQRRVRERFGHDGYFDLMSSLPAPNAIADAPATQAVDTSDRPKGATVSAAVGAGEI